MPNWCFSSAIVSAKEESELEEFLSFIRQTHFSHHADFRTGEVEGETTGVFWNFVSPEDINAYYGKVEVMADDEGDDSIEHLRAVDQANGWYNWNSRNWGTKWDIAPPTEDEVEICKDSDHYFFVWNFSTAWAPPEPMYEEMAIKFPNLIFNYEVTEEANFFAGKVVYEDGERVIEQWIDNPTHDDFAELGVVCMGCSDDETEECYLKESVVVE